MRGFLAGVCFAGMLGTLVMALALGSEGDTRGAGVFIACAALFGAAGITFRRGE